MFIQNHHRIPLLLFLVVYWALLNYFTLHKPINFFNIQSADPINSTQLILSEEIQYPDFSLESQMTAVDLPHDWLNHGITQSSLWYIKEFSIAPSQHDTWAVYLPSVTHNAQVYINDIWVGHGSEPNDPVPRYHNHPLFFEFSKKLLNNNNTIAIRVEASHARQGLLGAFYIAPADQLRAAYEFKYFWRVELIQWITTTMFFTGFIIFCFWFARPKDTVYGIFSAMLVIWATHNLNLFVTHIPVSALLWESLIMATLGWTVVLMIYFNHRFIGDSTPLFEKLALLFAVCGLGIFLLPDLGQVLHIGYLVWDSFLIIFGLYAITHLVQAFWKRRDWDIYLMLLAGIPILVFGLHDILVVNHLKDRTEGLIIQYSVIPAMALFTWFLIRRFVNSLNEAEHLNANLEQRVKQKEEEIQTQYSRLREFEHKALLSSERERIMRDMHDGLGGQLLSLKKFVHAQTGDSFSLIQQKLNNSLVDLRIVIDSLDPALSDMNTLLGNLRNRLEQQLLGTNIQLIWNIHDVPESLHLSPQQNLHFMRIIQEAINNAIKHSDSATIEIEVKTTSEENQFFIAVKDQGNKQRQHLQSKGRGIDNMHYRAQQLNGQLLVDIQTSGTIVKLLLPLSENT